MAFSVVKILMFIAYCGVQIIEGVELNRDRYDREDLFIPPGSNLQEHSHISSNKHLPDGWEDVFKVPHSSETKKSPTTSNDGRQEISRWNPRSSETNLPLYYYYQLL